MEVTIGYFLSSCYTEVVHSAHNMDELYLLISEEKGKLTTLWGAQPKHIKRKTPSQRMYKIKIKNEMVKEFKDFMNQQDVYNEEVRYAPALTIWSVETDSRYDMNKIRFNKCVESVEDGELELDISDFENI